MCSKAVRLNKIIIYYIQSFNCRVSCYCHPILTLLNCKMSNVEDFSNDGYDEALMKLLVRLNIALEHVLNVH
jgi:hypothetical protein